MEILRRPRRNRKSKAIRELVQETRVETRDLVFPLFLIDQRESQPIASMPGQLRHSLPGLLKEVESCLELGLKSFALFPVVSDERKDSKASYSYDSSNFYVKAISEIKKRFPESIVISDVAMDPYSSDGHDGLVIGGEVINDPSVEILAKMSLAQASAGADIIAPSDMMDGRVGAIRGALDREGFQNTSIMAYSVKYASHFYGPFRDALDSAPRFGDKKSYQMDYHNRAEALIEAELDILEGADFLMVKPALSYLDIISDLTQISSLPVAAYHVSGEYAMVKAASERGWINEAKVRDEVLTSIRRAGAKVILTYFAKDFAVDQTRGL